MLDSLKKFRFKKEGVEPTPEEAEEEKAKFQRLRHGLGIQLYGKTEEGECCKYAGEWHQGQVHGDGHYVYPDGSQYRGNFDHGVFSGLGEYTWPIKASNGLKANHCFKGTWVDGKMHGKGEFKHADGHVLKGFFANNLFELVSGK